MRRSPSWSSRAARPPPRSSTVHVTGVGPFIARAAAELAAYMGKRRRERPVVVGHSLFLLKAES